MAPDQRVTTRNARFQQWQTLLTNRTKRGRAGEFLVQGVRPISLAIEHGWPIREVLYSPGRGRSVWAREVLATTRARRVEVAPELLAELGEKDDVPELLAVIEMPDDDINRIPATSDLLAVVLDRPSSPGNVGTLIRSTDAFGGHGLIVAGHAADPYDPKAVRASTGSLFALPTVRVPGAREVLDHVADLRRAGIDVCIIGTDETGTVDVADHDLTRPTIVVIGNETTGLSAAWREAVDVMVNIPIGGAASSLNAANAGTVVLYEAARQRR